VILLNRDRGKEKKKDGMAGKKKKQKKIRIPLRRKGEKQ